MKAVTIDEYGDLDRVRYGERPEPKLGPDQVLVRTRAAGVNPVDWKIVGGGLDPWFEVHFPVVLGWDLAGVVERPGPAVSEFAPDDEVVGYVREDHIQRGTYAELVAAPVRTLAPKPRNVSWTQAAGLPLAGLTAYQALRYVLGVTSGDVVLVHAAAGGVGSMAVQIAKALGAARVIGTASQRNHDYLRSLGAEPVEYGEGLADRVRSLVPEGPSAILDLVGGETLRASVDLVSSPGRVVSILEPGVPGTRYHFVRPDPNDLRELVRLVEEGRLEITVEATYPLAEARAALEHNRRGHTRGKVVVEVAG